MSAPVKSNVRARALWLDNFVEGVVELDVDRLHGAADMLRNLEAALVRCRELIAQELNVTRPNASALILSAAACMNACLDAIEEVLG